GQLLAEYLIRRGHTRIALLSNQSHRPGDDASLEGVSEARGNTALPATALVVRTAAPTLDAVPGQIDQLLSMASAPTAIIARSRPLAQLAGATLRRDNPSATDFEVVFDDYSTDQSAAIHLVRASSTLRFEQIASRIGAMLSAAIKRTA